VVLHVRKEGRSIAKPLFDLVPFYVFFGASLYYAHHSEIALQHYPLVTVSAFCVLFCLCGVPGVLWCAVVFVICIPVNCVFVLQVSRHKHALSVGALTNHVPFIPSSSLSFPPSPLPPSQLLCMGSTMVDLVVHMMVSHICHGTIMPLQRTVSASCTAICVVVLGLLY